MIFSSFFHKKFMLGCSMLTYLLRLLRYPQAHKAGIKKFDDNVKKEE
jgi:hypothetical protein